MTIHEAAAAGDAGKVRDLLDGGSDVHSRRKDHSTPLHEAAMRGRTETCLLLLDHGANPNARAKSDATPLHPAEHGEHPETAAALPDRGAREERVQGAGQVVGRSVRRTVDAAQRRRSATGFSPSAVRPAVATDGAWGTWVSACRR